MSRKTSLVFTYSFYLLTLIVGYILSDLLHIENILVQTLIIDVLLTLMVFIGSFSIRNSSLYDPYWSIIPLFIVLYWMNQTSSYDILSYVLLFGVFVWSLRLTRNWTIDFKGYSRYEDFRYLDFKKKFKKYYWPISFLGIHLFPTLIVYIGLVPLYFVFSSEVTSSIFIYIGTIIMCIGAIISFIADMQLRKHKRSGNSDSIMTGLWKYSRHPNYFGEVTFWVGVFASSLSIGFYWELSIGMIAMLALFNLYSVPKMEDKLLKNKPDYQKVVDEVPRFFFALPKESGLDKVTKD